MPFSIGVLFGLLVVVIGSVLYATTRLKKAAVVITGVGAVIALLTLAVLILAVNSKM